MSITDKKMRSSLIEDSIREAEQKYDEDQNVFLTMLAETNLIDKPWEKHFVEFKGMKGKLDNVTFKSNFR